MLLGELDPRQELTGVVTPALVLQVRDYTDNEHNSVLVLMKDQCASYCMYVGAEDDRHC